MDNPNTFNTKKRRAAGYHGQLVSARLIYGCLNRPCFRVACKIISNEAVFFMDIPQTRLPILQLHHKPK